MANDFIGVDITGVKELQKLMRDLPDDVAGAGVETANEYLVEYERHYPPSQAGRPFQWSSDKQRRYVMAKLRRENNLPYKRTQRLAQGWRVEGKGKTQIVVNEVPYAAYVKDIATQIKGHFLRGWEVIQRDVIDRGAQIVRKFEAGVKGAIHRKKLD